MDLTLAERVTAVETKVVAIRDSQLEIAVDVRTIRDYVLAEQAKRATFRKIFATVAGVVTTGATLWRLFGDFFKKFV